MSFRLKDICEIQSGGTPDRSNLDYFEPPEIPWVKVGDISDERTLYTTDEYISKQGLNSIGNRFFNKGTLLLAIYGSTRGKSTIAGIDLSCNQAILGINTKDNQVLDNSYLKYWFDYNLDEHRFRSKGGAQKNLNANYIKNLEITPPSIDFQRDSVSKLQKILDLIEIRKNTIEQLNNYKKNIFIDFFFENPVYNQKSSYWGVIDEVIEDSKYGISKGSTDSKTGIPMLRMNNITYDGEIDLSDMKWIELEVEEIEKYQLKDGDVLFNRTNSKELVGKTTVWEKGEGYTFAGYLVKLILKKDKMTPYYFSGYMNSDFGKKILFNKGKSSGSQVNFSPPLLKTQKILIPELEDQLKFDKIYKKAKVQKETMGKSLELLQELFKAMMNKVFGKQPDVFDDEISLLINDDIQLELFLNTIIAMDYRAEEDYEIDLKKLYKILDRTDRLNKIDKNNRKGIVQTLKGNNEVIIETTKEYKDRLNNEATQN